MRLSIDLLQVYGDCRTPLVQKRDNDVMIALLHFSVSKGMVSIMLEELSIA